MVGSLLFSCSGLLQSHQTSAGWLDWPILSWFWPAVAVPSAPLSDRGQASPQCLQHVTGSWELAAQPLWAQGPGPRQESVLDGQAVSRGGRIPPYSLPKSLISSQPHWKN